MKLKSIVAGLIVLLAITMPLAPILVDSILIILACVLSIVVLVKDKPDLRIALKTYAPFLIYYAVLIIGLTYTENLNKGFFQLEKKLAFIILPLVCFAIKDSFYIRKMPLYFSYGMLFTALFCDLMMKINSGTFFSFGYAFLLFPLDIDPTYFSMYALFAMVVLFNSKTPNSYLRAFHIISICYLLFFYLRMGSKVGIVALVIVMLYMGFSILRKKSIKAMLIFIVAVLLVLALTFYMPLTYSRFYAPFIDNNFDFYQLRMRFFNERYYAWSCSIDAINMNSLLMGYGTGDDLATLKDCYESNRRTYVLNSHSIYFSSLVKNGLLGLVSLAILITRGFRSKQLNFQILSLIIIITGLTESVFERQKGIVFFALFCAFFLIQSIQNKEKTCVE